MRLIDADELKEVLEREKKNYIVKDTYTKGKNAALRMVEILVDEQPTVYDVDKVVEQLEERTYREHGRVVTWDAIEIVKSGMKGQGK